MNTDGSPGDVSDSSEDETWPKDGSKGRDSNTHQYGYLFQLPSTPSDSNLRDFRPLPSQIPFLLEMFSENVYPLLCVVHMPSIKKMVHDMRSTGAKAFSAPKEALLYSIYYAAIVSMEEDEVSFMWFTIVCLRLLTQRLISRDRL